MKNQATVGTVGVAATAISLAVLFQPGARREEGSSPNPRGATLEKTSSGASPRKPDRERACDDMARTLASFLGEVRRPRSCFESETAYTHQKAASAKSKERELKFIVAMLPNPVRTHLPLLFDRMAEVIQEAAQDEGYSYDGSWLPWGGKKHDYALLIDDDRVSDRMDMRESQPGILLFRHQQKTQTGNSQAKMASDRQMRPMEPFARGLIVFIVGEQPTRGIQADQFKNGLDWINELQWDVKSPTRPVLLGPVFSGSFPSLAKLLSDDSGPFNKARSAWSGPLAIYSGTANDGYSIDNFRQTAGAGIDFRNFLERDDVGLERYCKYITSGERTDARRFAVVSEDETAFGGSQRGLTPPPQEPPPCLTSAVWLSYPRDISALRAAYQTNSVFNRYASDQSSGASRRQLPSDFADSDTNDKDTIRPYAGNQLALSQEAYLMGLVNALRQNHSLYVVLRGTNVLDQLFLTRYLRSVYPNARIVIDGADLLFEREQGTSGTGATMSLSTYPLLEREQEWLRVGKSMPERRLFNSDYSEGTYIAFRFLLHTEALSEPSTSDGCRLTTADARFVPPLPPTCRPTPSFPDYGVPAWMRPDSCPSCDEVYRRPPTWLSVLGRDGFWPIAAINEETLKKDPDEVDDSSPSHIAVSLKIWVIFLASFIYFHMWCCWRASLTSKPAFRTHFVNPDYPQHTGLVFLGSGFLAALPTLVAWGTGLLDGNAGRLEHPWQLGMVLAIEGFVALSATVANIVRNESLVDWKCAKNRIRPAAMVVLVFAGVIAGIVIFRYAFASPLQDSLTAANRFFTFYRNMHLLSGVSPIVPFLTLALGMYAWFWHSLHGLALFGKDRCLLPPEHYLQIPHPHDPKKALDVLRMFSQKEAERIESVAIPLRSPTIWLWPTLTAIVLGIIWIVFGGPPLQSLGNTNLFGTIFLICLVGCISLTIAEACQLLVTWTRLRAMLNWLDRTALRRTLVALRGFSWGSVWGMSGNVLEVRYKLLSRQLESLRHTLSAFAVPEVSAERLSDQSVNACVDALNETQKQGIAVAEWYSKSYWNPEAADLDLLEDFQKTAANAAGTLLVRLLLPEWHRETISLTLGDEKDSAGHTDEHAPPLSKKEYIRDAEEFVCLLYMGFVQNMLGRIRSIVMSILWLFVAAAVAISSYPFDPRQGLSMSMFLVLLLLGAIVFYVYAQMHRDTTLSNVTNTTPGELGPDFWLKAASFGIAPLLGLLATTFPGMADSVLSWLQPGLQSLK